jgi:hypothetical protein
MIVPGIGLFGYDRNTAIMTYLIQLSKNKLAEFEDFLP